MSSHILCSILMKILVLLTIMECRVYTAHCTHIRNPNTMTKVQVPSPQVIFKPNQMKIGHIFLIKLNKMSYFGMEKIEHIIIIITITLLS